MEVKPRVIVLSYVGTELSKLGVAALANTLSQYITLAIPNIDHFEYDPQDIAKMVAAIKMPIQDLEGTNVAERAVVLIGSYMKKHLGENYTPEGFVFHITDIVKDRGRRFPDLYKAIQVLSEENLEISSNLLKKCKMDEKKIRTIKYVWNIANQ